MILLLILVLDRHVVTPVASISPFVGEEHESDFCNVLWNQLSELSKNELLLLHISIIDMVTLVW